MLKTSFFPIYALKPIKTPKDKQRLECTNANNISKVGMVFSINFGYKQQNFDFFFFKFQSISVIVSANENETI